MNLISMLIFVYIMSVSTFGAACLELKLTPRYWQAKPKSEVNLGCKPSSSSEPISSCQFQIWYNGKQLGGELLNITASKDPVSIRNPLASDGSYYIATSLSTNFETGDCGVTLTGVAGGQLLVGCKLTTKDNVTAVKTLALFYADKPKLELFDNSQDMHVTIGTNVSFKLKTKEGVPLSKCSLKVNGFYVDVFRANKSSTSKPITIENRYQAWLEGVECGYTIPNLTEEDDRTFFVVAENDKGKSTGAKVVTIFLQKQPEMFLDKDVKEYEVGDTLNATCTTRATMEQDAVWSWKLGEGALGIDGTPVHAPGTAWSWPWETHVVSDSRSVKLTKEDNNKDISCTFGTLNGDQTYDVTTSKQLNVKVATPETEPVTTSTQATENATVPPVTTSSSSKSTAEVPAAGGGNETQISSNTTSTKANSNAPAAREKNFGGGSAWQLTMKPADTAVIIKSITVLCKADRGMRLTECAFNIDTQDQGRYSNASSGSVSPGVVGAGQLSVKYLDPELDKGQCGIEVSATTKYNEEPFLVGCRARTEHSGWKYNYVYVVDSTWSPALIKLQTVPSWPFLRPGSNLTVRCDGSSGRQALKKCSFTLPGQETIDINESYEPKPPHNYQYVGKGLASGHCGIFIPDVSSLDTNTGNSLTCEIGLKKASPTRVIRIVVAAPPSGGPALTPTPEGYTEGPNMTFQCVAPASRPPATLAWLLGDEPVPPGSIREEPVDKWRWWRDKETTTQFLTLTLTEADEGKMIKCIMSHMALEESRNETLAIKIPRNPPVGDLTITFTPEKYSNETSVTFTCVAPASQPPANITWHSPEDRLVPSDRVSNEPIDKWRWWDKAEATTRSLTLDLTDADEGRNITCVMKYLNETKTSTLTITFLNNDKNVPGSISQGSQLGTLIGVLVGVLMVIAIVAAVAFAFVKKEACFKENGSEEASLNPAGVQDGRSAPQQGRRPPSSRTRGVPTQQVQPLRERRPTPPLDEHELQPMRPDEEPDEKVEYAEIVRAPDAPMPAVAPAPTPTVDEVEYTVLSWDHRK